MGYTIHHSIIVSMYRGQEKEIYDLAQKIFNNKDEEDPDLDVFYPRGIVLPPVELPINGGYLMTIYSNGSKSNWPEAEAWIKAANKFLNILNEKTINYVLVGFGGDQLEGEIMRDPTMSKLPKWYPDLGLETIEVKEEE